MQKKAIFKVFILFLSFSNLTTYAQTIWTVGPMIHINIGNQKARMSYNLEFAYWNFSKFPYSYDFAIEFERKKIRLYSEIQTGVGLAGISAGPVMEIQTDNSAVKFGFQGSIWGNYFLGFDLRARYIDNKMFFSPGVYVKGGFNGRDKDGNKIEHSSSFLDDLDD